MIVNDLKLKNFRNYIDLEISFNNNLNIIIGENAQGKTNILESLYVLALSKSYLVNHNDVLINNNSDFATITGKIISNNKKLKLGVVFTKNSKKVSINNNEIKRIGDYIRSLNILFFGPNDLKLIKDMPSIRRNFLNLELSQLSKSYLKNMNEYNQLIKQKNEYLKIIRKRNKAIDNYLLVLNNMLVDLSYLIFNDRRKFVDQLNEQISDIYFDITGNKTLIIKYVSQISNVDKEQFILKVNSEIAREINLGRCLYGIHLDDLLFTLDGYDLSKYGSQGQIRSAILALKLSELGIYKNRNGEYPVLLLDDIFSELDSIVKNKVMKYLNNNLQIIMTTTDIREINKEYVDNANVYQINNGKVVEIQYGRK